MARTVRDTNLESRAARLRLQIRRKPYWRVLESGLHLGYRRTQSGSGSWIARRFLGAGSYSEEKVGVADDFQEPDGVIILGFGQSQQKARLWHNREIHRELGIQASLGPYTVADALGDYLTARENRGSKGVSSDRASANARILPPLGEKDVAKLTSEQIRNWLTDLAKAPKLVRNTTGQPSRSGQPVDMTDSEAVRARRATANRVLTILKAALNHAFHEGHTTSDTAWRKIKPFREVDAPIIRFLEPDEALRIINAADSDFRNLVRGALLTGCRYGELTRMRASDFNSNGKSITVRTSKSSKPRHVHLNDEGTSFFKAMAAKAAPQELIFKRSDDTAWAASQQTRPLNHTCQRAQVDPAVTFHIFRHTYASALAMEGVPMAVIAAQLGHSGTRMTERHYAHLAPSYIANTVRAAMPHSGFLETGNVTRFKRI